MTDFLTGLRELQEQKEQERTSDFWKGHSLFQVPYSVVSFKGQAEALVLLYLYERANSIAFYSEAEIIIEIPVREKTIAALTGLGRTAVSEAILTLEAAGLIRVVRKHDPVTNLQSINVYLLMHSQTKAPLVSRPGVFGICHINFDRPYVTVPKESRRIMSQMTRPARAVYLVALAIGSRKLLTSFGITRDDWKTESLLKKDAFNRGLRECKLSKALSYKRSVLTLLDPATGAPSARQKHTRIEHANPKWKFDYDTVTATAWQRIIEDLLGRKFIIGSDGWTVTSRQGCPFCKKPRCFAVNFQRSRYICHEGCGRGRLAQLVCRALRVSPAEAKLHVMAAIQTSTVAR